MHNADTVAVGKFLEVQGAASSHLMLGEVLKHMTFVDICVLSSAKLCAV